tara:strand:- start:1601 stop:2860 length:1260 start_codon:yes stop_codon:yes gene_type:complete
MSTENEEITLRLLARRGNRDLINYSTRFLNVGGSVLYFWQTEAKFKDIIDSIHPDLGGSLSLKEIQEELNDLQFKLFFYYDVGLQTYRESRFLTSQVLHNDFLDALLMYTESMHKDEDFFKGLDLFCSPHVQEGYRLMKLDKSLESKIGEYVQMAFEEVMVFGEDDFLELYYKPLTHWKDKVNLRNVCEVLADSILGMLDKHENLFENKTAREEAADYVGKLFDLFPDEEKAKDIFSHLFYQNFGAPGNNIKHRLFYGRLIKLGYAHSGGPQGDLPEREKTKTQEKPLEQDNFLYSEHGEFGEALETFEDENPHEVFLEDVLDTINANNRGLMSQVLARMWDSGKRDHVFLFFESTDDEHYNPTVAQFNFTELFEGYLANGEIAKMDHAYELPKSLFDITNDTLRPFFTAFRIIDSYNS